MALLALFLVFPLCFITGAATSSGISQRGSKYFQNLFLSIKEEELKSRGNSDVIPNPMITDGVDFLIAEVYRAHEDFATGIVKEESFSPPGEYFSPFEPATPNGDADDALLVLIPTRKPTQPSTKTPSVETGPEDVPKRAPRRLQGVLETPVGHQPATPPTFDQRCCKTVTVTQTTTVRAASVVVVFFKSRTHH